MAKARIGHFAEAQVLEALEVDYIDESEVLTPADEAQPHRQVGVQGAVRVRRDEPRRGAAAHRRGRGDDPLQGRGRHRRHRRGGPPPARDHRRDPAPRDARRAELRPRPRSCGAPLDLVRGVAARGPAARPAVLRRRHRHAGRRRAGDAARRRGRLRRLRDLQVRGPATRARARSSRRRRTSRTPSASPRVRGPRRARWQSLEARKLDDEQLLASRGW